MKYSPVTWLIYSDTVEQFKWLLRWTHNRIYEIYRRSTDSQSWKIKEKIIREEEEKEENILDLASQALAKQRGCRYI